MLRDMFRCFQAVQPMDRRYSPDAWQMSRRCFADTWTTLCRRPDDIYLMHNSVEMPLPEKPRRKVLIRKPLPRGSWQKDLSGKPGKPEKP
jgi:hypothetical protein